MYTEIHYLFCPCAQCLHLLTTGDLQAPSVHHGKLRSKLCHDYSPSEHPDLGYRVGRYSEARLEKGWELAGWRTGALWSQHSARFRCLPPAVDCCTDVACYVHSFGRL